VVHKDGQSLLAFASWKATMIRSMEGDKILAPATGQLTRTKENERMKKQCKTAAAASRFSVVDAVVCGSPPRRMQQQ